MKQYRLKITWSNGDSEYFGGIATKDRMETIRNSLMEVEYYQIKDVTCISKFIRRFEIEEIHTEGNEKF